MDKIAGDCPGSLITETPADGFALAIKFSRLGVRAVQPDVDILRKLRATYSENADNLIASSQVIATYFQTIALANHHWPGR